MYKESIAFLLYPCYVCTQPMFTGTDSNEQGEYSFVMLPLLFAQLLCVFVAWSVAADTVGKDCNKHDYSRYPRVQTSNCTWVRMRVRVNPNPNVPVKITAEG